MTREDSPVKEVIMEQDDPSDHAAPLATMPASPMEEDIIFAHRVNKKRGGTFPRMAHFDVPEDTPPGSENGTLKANGTQRPQRQNGSLKGPWNRKHRGKGVPVVRADTAKVLEMYLKRRSKSLNDAVLTREYFAQEKKRKVRSGRNNTVSICSTLSTDSTTSEILVQAEVTMETAADADRSVFTRGSTTQKSFHEAMKRSIMEEGSSTMEQSADDELSSTDDASLRRPRSAPSTLRMQVQRDTKEGMDTLKLQENGTATLTRDGYKRDPKKEPRRKRSFLDKAKQIIRSPSTSRKVIRTPSSVHRLEEKEKEREKERLKEEKEREKEEKEREKERQKERLKEEKEKEKERLKRAKEEKEVMDKKLKEYKEREREKLKEMERLLKEGKEKRDKLQMDKRNTTQYARNVVHHEMERTGFTDRLRQTFRRSSRDKHRHREQAKTKPSDVPPPLPPRPPELQQSKDVKPKRWPSLNLRRKSRKSASTPTDESGACATTPSDTASMDFEYFATRYDHTRSLNDAERRRLTIEMRRGATRENSGNASDSQILDRGVPLHPPLSQATSHDSFGSFASSEGSERPERPRSLVFRRTRAERAQRGLNNVIRLDSTTPGHMRRDVDTAAPLLPLPAAMAADDLVRDGGGGVLPQGGAQGGDDRTVNDSWTESGDGSDIPFEQRNQEEREEYFKRIADRLAMIGDQALAEHQDYGAEGGGQERAVHASCTAETFTSCASAAVGGATASAGFSMEYTAIGQRIRTDVDGLQRRQSLALFPAQMVMGVILNDTYQSFCSTMQDIVGQDVGWEQLAIVFKFTKVAVKAAHSMGKHASSIKDNSVRFIGDRFAAWLDSQGGWGSVVTSDDSDSLHEESEID